MNSRLGIFTILLLALPGCLGPQSHPPSADEVQRDKELEVRTIGDVTEVDNVQPIQVSGVGLVTGLEATGQSPKSAFRTMLEKQLRTQKVENVESLLNSPNNCLVLVTAFIPAGSRTGELLKVEVTLPPGSHATSLRGGYLQDCILREYHNTKELVPAYEGPDSLKAGHILAHARGPLMVGFGGGEEADLKRGLVWGGGISHIDRPFYLLLKDEEKSARIAGAVVERLNFMFADDARSQRQAQQNQRLYLLDEVARELNERQGQSTGQADLARAVNKDLINLRVPYAYRYDPKRYLRVARLIPLREVPENRSRYRSRLQKMLLEPSDSVRAALRLEALGKESIPTLKRGLENEHPLIRFTSAEALAYLGSTAGVEELARLAHDQPLLRGFCLTALSSLDEGICRTKLGEMLTMEDAALRCGAFQALRLLDESPARLQKDLGGELLNRSYWLHQVAPQSTRLVHFALAQKPEIVLFGEGIRLAPVKVLAGADFVVTVEQADDRCTIGRITNQGTLGRKQCTLQLDDVLRTMAELGAGYPEAVDLLRKLDDRQALNCPVMANALPPQVSVEELAEAGRTPNSFAKK